MHDTFTVPSIVDTLILLENRIAAAYERTLRGMPEGRFRVNCSGIWRAHRLAAQLLNGRLDGGEAFGGTTPQAFSTELSTVEPRGLCFLIGQEKLAIRQYEAVLDEDSISPGTRDLIVRALLPEAREHHDTLESILREAADDHASSELVAVAIA